MEVDWMLATYADMRQRALDELRIAASLAREMTNTGIERRLAEAIERLESNRFYLVVLGHFKRGKTTLINALLGEKLLPTAVVPLTSIITMIRYGPEIRANVFFSNKKNREIPVDELPLFITELENPNNVKNVEYVEIALPSSCLADGVVLVDTPGVGSLYRHNTEVAYNFLPSADAAIFVLTVDPPLSEAEGEYLKEIREYVPKIFFTLNKVDYLNDKDREKALAFSQEAVEVSLGKNGIELYPLSAKLALEAKLTGNLEALGRSGLPQLERDLSEFLTAGRGKIALTTAVRRGKQATSELKGLLELERKAVEMPVKELQDKIAAFEEQLTRILDEKADALYILQGEMGRVIKIVEEDLEVFKASQIPLLREKISAFAKDKRDLSAKALAKGIETFVVETLTYTFNAWRMQEEAKIAALFKQILQRFAIQVNEVIGRIRELSAGLFDIRLEGFVEVESLTTDSSFYYKFGKERLTFAVAPSSLSVLLPKSIGHRLVINQALNDAQGEVDRNCGRVRWDFQQRTNKSFLDFKYSFGEKIEATIQAIRRVLGHAVSQKDKSEEEIRKTISTLESQYGQVEDCRKSLLSIEEWASSES
jgi:ribosome biogenesis GTPase A